MHQRVLTMTRHTAGHTGYHSHYSHTTERTSVCVNFNHKLPFQSSGGHFWASVVIIHEERAAALNSAQHRAAIHPSWIRLQ